MLDLKGNKGEWSELYTTLKLLAEGEIYAADENMEKLEKLVFPILTILKHEKEKEINYIVNGDITLQDGATKENFCTIDRARFLRASDILFRNIKRLKGRSINIDRFSERDELVAFLKEAQFETLKAKSTDKSDIVIQIHDQLTGTDPILGFSIKSMLGQRSTLFNPGAGTNFIFRVEGTIPSENQMGDINRRTYEQINKIGKRIAAIEESGGSLVFDSIQSEMLQLNLALIDGDLPKILAYMLKIRYTTGKTRLLDLADELERINPLSYNLEHGHPFYRYKLIKFLYDVALGMTPESIWNGEIKANGGIIVVKNDGDVLAYHTYHKAKFEEYLLSNTCLEQPATSEDESEPGTAQTRIKYPYKRTIKPFKFGWLYRESKVVKLKMCLQVRFSV